MKVSQCIVVTHIPSAFVAYPRPPASEVYYMYVAVRFQVCSYAYMDGAIHDGIEINGVLHYLSYMDTPYLRVSQ